MRKTSLTLAVVWTLGILLAGAWVGPALARSNNSLLAKVQALQSEVSTLEGEVTALQTQLSSSQAQNAFALGSYVTVDPNAESGVSGPNIVFKGANIHIESGSGNTVDTTGLGNLIIGYDEENGVSFIEYNRRGSHNLIIGPGHIFTASGGLIAGYENAVASNYSIAGGECNAVGQLAQGINPSCRYTSGTSDGASVTGGIFNLATGLVSSVSGGILNTASGEESSVSGGGINTASGEESSASGGHGNEASGSASTISGGTLNTASGSYSSVGGGSSQTASGTAQNVN